MKIKSPEHFLKLKNKWAQFIFGDNFNVFHSEDLKRIEDFWENEWKLYFTNSYQDLTTWKQVENNSVEIINKELLSVWYLPRKFWNADIPLIFSWKELNFPQMLKLREKMRLVWQEIDFLYKDFITGKSIRFDMWQENILLSNINEFYLRSFLSRISTGLYKITENPASKDNTSLRNILDSIQKLDILSWNDLTKIKCDLKLCDDIWSKIWVHSRNELVAHMDYKSHSELSQVNESERAIYVSLVTIDNWWWDDIKTLHEIHAYWLAVIFAINYQPNISQPHNPQELNEYEYRLFLTVFDKQSWEQETFDD